MNKKLEIINSFRSEEEREDILHINIILSFIDEMVNNNVISSEDVELLYKGNLSEDKQQIIINYVSKQIQNNIEKEK